MNFLKTIWIMSNLKRSNWVESTITEVGATVPEPAQLYDRSMTAN